MDQAARKKLRKKYAVNNLLRKGITKYGRALKRGAGKLLKTGVFRETLFALRLPNRLKPRLLLFSRQNTAITMAAVACLIFLAALLITKISAPAKRGSADADKIAAFSLSPDAFACIDTLSQKYGIGFYEMLSVYCLESSVNANKETGIRTIDGIEKTFAVNYPKIKRGYKNNVIKQYSEMLRGIVEDIESFPIPKGFNMTYIYDDSWGQARDYKSTRIHQGCDIMDSENTRGRIPVLSMTDGVIENIGWNELGGYRIGVRAASGTYYYYAHMERFSAGLAKGGQITAGQTIGYMGDTGYGKKEGTKGNFAVHLHVGIMPDVGFKKEYWVNPYPFLRYIEDNVSL